jgi:N-formylglutamate amidohydrolase
MTLFKRSNKNKSASAASTLAQTPRTSMQTLRNAGIAMTPEEALQRITRNMMANASNGPFVR